MIAQTDLPAADNVVEKLTNDRVLSVAPMIDWTDRHCRYFLRLLNPFAWLYTEMLVADALVHHRDPDYLLKYHPDESPVVLQLGGSEIEPLCRAAKMAALAGYSEINLNVGCPSDRVQQGRFGACLMAEPERVANLVQAMQSAVSIPVTVKTRLGIDDFDDYDFLFDFISQVAAAGCDYFIIHARKAFLQGLNPKQNRTIPPLNYDRVLRLQADFPQLVFCLNGGIDSVAKSLDCLTQFPRIMLGRLAYNQPYVLAELASHMAGLPCPSREAIAEAYLPYVEQEFSQGMRLTQLLKPVLGLYHGQPGARLFRRHLSEAMPRSSARPELLLQAIKCCQSHC